MGKDFTHYEKDGKKFERFSTVAEYFMAPSLVAWKVRVGQKTAGLISRAALRVGSRVDELCEADVRDGSYRLGARDNAEVRSCMKGWEQWKTDWAGHYTDSYTTQETVFYDEWLVAGTADLFGGGRIIDIKTSKKISLMNWVQLAFYNKCLGCRDRYILRLDKALGTYEYTKCPERYSQEYLEQVFVGLLNVFNYFKSED